MKDRNHTDAIRRIQADQAFTLAGGLIDEDHLAAYLDTPRTALLRDLFHPKGQPGLPYVKVGNRHICTVKTLVAYVAKHEKAQSRTSGRGRRCVAKGGVS